MTNKNTLSVVAMIVDKQCLTLYLQNGTTYRIDQGDPDLKRIVDEAMPIIQAGQIATVSLSEETNAYHQVENESKGFVRFFKIAKNKITNLFKTEEPQILPSMVVGQIPTGNKMQQAVDDIISNSEKQPNPIHPSKKIEDDETIVAVVKTKDGNDKIIPGMENMKGQIKHFAGKENKLGLEKFLARIASIIEERSHSVEDLLRFMERGDLPIADDGCIIGYKVLRRYQGQNGVYVDCHTQKIQQKIGSRVFVDEKLVDRNRQNECSNGLHVARRAYISCFSGDVCVLVKVAPENVVTVPHRDANKVRVSEYHILAELPSVMYNRVKQNLDITNTEEGQILLAKMIKGDHIGVIQDVHIKGQLGTDVEYTNFFDNKEKQVSASTQPIEPAVAIDLENIDSARVMNAPKINPQDVQNKVIESSPIQKRIGELFDKFVDGQAGFITKNEEIAAAKELIEIKKKRKVSWEKLFGSHVQVTLIEKITASAKMELVNEPVKAEKPVKKPPVVTAPKRTGKPKARGKAPVKQPKVPVVKAPEEPKPTKTAQRVFFEQKDWKNLYAFKKKVKKGWTNLGFNEKEVETISKNNPNK